LSVGGRPAIVQSQSATLITASNIIHAPVAAPAYAPVISTEHTGQFMDGTPGWVQITTTTSPPGGGKYSMVYDSIRHRTVLFDGCSTWEYDGVNWVQMSLTNSPPNRRGFALAYDSARGRVVLFGGYASGSYFNDTWEYDGTSWIQVVPSSSPSARAYHAMAYDSARSRVVLFGGLNQYGSTLNDTWEYNGTTWVSKSFYTKPYSRMDHAMVYDSGRSRVILYGGADYRQNLAFLDTWEYDGTTWVNKSPANGPLALAGHALAYDASRGRVILFGGTLPIPSYPIYNYTWEYDGTNWTQVYPTTSPSERTYHAMTYDSDRNRVVLFGGCNRPSCSGLGIEFFSDTWEYTPPPTNDDFNYADLISEPPANGQPTQILDTDTTDETVAADDPDMGCGAGVNSHTIWYKLTPSYYGRVRLSTYNELDPAANSTYDTVLAVFTGQRGSLQRIACNDDASGHEPLSDLTFEVEPGQMYYIEVASYGNSPGGTLSLFCNYQVSPKAWTLMFYIAANNDLEEFLFQERESLSLAARNLNVNVVALWESNWDSTYIVFAPGGSQKILKADLNTGDPQTLRDFVTWAIEEYPANYYALIISNHGQGFSGTSIDYSSHRDWLTVRETDQALIGIYPKPDIIYMHACLMATLDSAYQLAEQADYYIASESQAWAPIRYDYFITGMPEHRTEVSAIRSDTSPTELALAMAESYVYQFMFTPEGRNPSTISVIKLSEITDVAVAASDLAGLLKNRMGTVKTALNSIWEDVQRFDESWPQEINTADRAADLYHFASLVSQRISDADIQGAAWNLMNKISAAVLFNEAWSGYPNGGNAYWYHGDAHGISVFLPSGKKQCYYTGDWLDFAYGTDWGCHGATSIIGSSLNIGTPFEWGPMMVEYFNQTNPSAPEELNPPEPVPLLTSHNVYLPLVLR